MNSSPALDISSELEDLAKADAIAEKLAARKMEREKEVQAKIAPVQEQREPTEVEKEQIRLKREAKAEAARKREEARQKCEQEEEDKQKLLQKQSEPNWVTPGFKVDSAKLELIDRIFYKMKLDGVGYKHKQLLVDEAIDWLIEKHKQYL